MDFEARPEAKALAEKVREFIDTEVRPVESALAAQAGRDNHPDFATWVVSPDVERLKHKAKSRGLWNLFWPKDPFTGEKKLSLLDYALVAEEMGKSFLAAEVFNCNAPDSGNMEVLAEFGSDEQKARWLGPLMDGEIRSAFCMTEPNVASSDATSIAATVTFEGDEVVLNGTKWWSTGIGHPACKLAFFLGRSSADGPRHGQHTLVAVPMPTPGVHIERMLSVFGYYDPPFGHGQVRFESVRLPRTAVVGEEGRAFSIAQSRLARGRIHHCMRCIGAAEHALSLLVRRSMTREAFGKPLVKLGGTMERIAELRVAIDQARLLTLHAAWKIETVGDRAAAVDVAAIKLVAPRLLERVVDEAIQVHGAAGLSAETPLAGFFAIARSLRIADGPDEVHRATIGRAEVAKHLPPGYRSESKS